MLPSGHLWLSIYRQSFDLYLATTDLGRAKKNMSVVFWKEGERGREFEESDKEERKKGERERKLKLTGRQLNDFCTLTLFFPDKTAMKIKKNKIEKKLEKN